MKPENEQWAKTVLNLAVAIMETTEEHSPREVLPALVSCIQTTITLVANDRDHAKRIIDLVKDKLDEYELQHESIVKLYKSIPEGDVQ